MVTLTIELEREDDGRWLAEVPALSGVLRYGSDRDEALPRVQAFALRVLADRLDHRETAEFLNVVFKSSVSNWPFEQADVCSRALLRIGWSVER